MSEGPAGRGGGVEPGRVSSRPIYSGRIVNLNLDTVRFPDGSTGELEMIRHSGAAAVLPVVGSMEDEDPEVVLVRQYRYAADGYVYEVPAGRPTEPGEDWEVCARRELEEETGLRAGQLRKLTMIYTTPGFTDERIHLFLATELEEGAHARDADEFMDVVRLPFSRVLEMVRDGEIIDAKSICTILYAAGFVFGL
ncbi:MAG TPA: NUDIX hydrolase [Longimicrobiaceae bacterium]|nr:NUDIX hydrolase [Longimicrobiaceae bacterium]